MAIKIGARDLRILAPLTKVEPQADGSLLVEGVATSEAVDEAGEVIDYGTAKQAFGAWRGNIREQHDPTKAVGHALDVIPDDEAKNVVVRAFVSKGAPDTQAKVLDGTLSFYSIGGRKKAEELDKTLKTADGKPAHRLFMERISEVSLVDSGCNPDSAISVLRAVGFEEVEKINKPKIEQQGGKWAVVDSDGKVYGTHDTKAEAKQQLAALYAAKEKTDMPENAQQKPTLTELVAKYDGFEIADARAALQALEIVEGLLSVETMNEEHPEPPEQITALKRIVADLKTFIASEITEEDDAEVAAADKADVPGEPTPAPAAGDPPVVKQDDTPPPDDKPKEPPAEPAGEPSAPPEGTQKAVTKPAANGGLDVSGLVTKLETLTADLATLKTELATKGEENAALRKQVGGLSADVAKLGKQVVEPGQPVFKGHDGKPTTQPPDTQATITIPPETLEKIVREAGGDVAKLQRDIAYHVAEAQVSKIVNRK